MNAILRDNTDKISELCSKYSVKHLFAFGSVLNKNFNSESDIDFLIDFKNVALLDYFDNYMDLKEEMELLLDRPVDLVEETAIKNPIFKKIVDDSKVKIYEGNHS